jgi:hypothetical protein
MNCGNIRGWGSDEKEFSPKWIMRMRMINIFKWWRRV